jgi:cysteinyl-tRNA synthetase
MIDAYDARKAKNFAEVDRIRTELALKGILLEDGPGGATWRRGVACGTKGRV